MTVSFNVSGPVTGGSRGWVFGSPCVDLAEYGYVEEEFFLEGLATRYGLVGGGEPSPDGRWEVESAGESQYRTRFIVWRPREPDRFNGTVLLMWNNVTATFDTPTIHAGFLRDGFAVVGVTAQRVGVHGLGANPLGLVYWDPDRYGSLSIPSDDYSFDIFTHSARAVGKRREPGQVDPMGGLEVSNLIAHGSSQAAARLATYINAIHPIEGAIDGFLPGLYFGRGTGLEVGEAVVDPADRETLHRITGGGTHILRDDIDVPVMVVNTESEAASFYPVRQPDTDRFRFWEIAGASHAGSKEMRAMSERTQRDFGFAFREPEGLNEVSPGPVFDAAYHHMRRWVAGGQPPPVQPPLEFVGSPAEMVRDADGLARGGVRLPQVEVPTARIVANTPDDMSGSYLPFTVEEMRDRYHNRSTFLARFEGAADAAVAAGVLLSADRDALVAEASARFPSD